MGRTLDALLRRNFRTSKFKALVTLAISRIAILKNQHQVRSSLARSDVAELLKLGHQERALLRVEQVIKEQNMLDAFFMIETYCHLLIERVVLIQKNKECPDELKEAISSLIFASSRCGEFPELLHIRGIFTSRFGKDFAARAVELRNNCGVNHKMIQKLSARKPSLESRLKVLKEIASANGIMLQFEEDAPVVTEEELDINQKQKQSESVRTGGLEDPELRDDTHEFPGELNLDERLSESIKARKKYGDVVTAAQEAFKSAAYAAAAARAAVELSRSESQDNNPDNGSGTDRQQGTMYDLDGSSTVKSPSEAGEASERFKHSKKLEDEEIHPVDNFSSESERENLADSNLTLPKAVDDSKHKGIQKAPSASGSDSNLSCQNDQLNGEIDMNRAHELASDLEPSLPTNENQHARQHDTADEENISELEGNKLAYLSLKSIPFKSQTDSMIKPEEEKSRLTSTYSLNFVEHPRSEHSTINKNWVSMRTIRAPKV